MGLLDLIFGPKLKKQPAANAEVFKLLSGYRPVFRTWGGELYESELIRAAIDAKARHISKLDVVVNGTAKPGLQSKLKLGPNQWQTWSQFLYRLSTILDMKNTAIIVPVVDEYGETSGIYPVLYQDCEVVQSNGELWLRMKFSNNEHAAALLRDVGIMTKFQYRSDYFGDSNSALGPTMELLEIQRQGIEEGVKSAATYQFMATLSNFTNSEDLAKERKRFTRENLQGKETSGVLLWPNTYKDVKQITSTPYVADAEQVKIINTNVFNYFGVNEEVLQNKAIGDAWSAYYEGSIEPFAVQLSQVITKMLFSVTERQRGSYVMATANRLQYMSNQDKLNVSAQMADRGLMTRNEIREIWNLPPLPENVGNTLPVRGEYYDLNAANEGGQENATE